MACVVRDPGGKKRIQISSGGGGRCTIRLGVCTAAQAESFWVKVDAVIAARLTGCMDAETANWIKKLEPRIHAKLAKAGLVEPRERSAPTLGALIEDYFETLNVKIGTRRAYEQASGALKAHFGDGRLLSTITGELKAHSNGRSRRRGRASRAD